MRHRFPTPRCPVHIAISSRSTRTVLRCIIVIVGDDLPRSRNHEGKELIAMLELKDIVVNTEDGKGILNGVNLEVGDGRFVAITGPNGGGKSTLGKVVMGIIRPDSGRVIFDGQDITDASISDRARMGIALAFQQPVRFKGIGVRDMIELALGKHLDDTELCGYLSEVGLCARDYIDRPVDASLSGGEIKRIEIATIMARRARLSVFDEPEAGIDLWSFQNLLDVFRKIRTEQGGSILIISHQERILEIADEIVVIAEGTIASRGTPEDILHKLLCSDERCDLCPQGFGDFDDFSMAGASAKGARE